MCIISSLMVVAQHSSAVIVNAAALEIKLELEHLFKLIIVGALVEHITQRGTVEGHRFECKHF